MKILDGKKTYLVSLLMVLYGVLGVILQQMSFEQAVQFVLSGAAFAALRKAV